MHYYMYKWYKITHCCLSSRRSRWNTFELFADFNTPQTLQTLHLCFNFIHNVEKYTKKECDVVVEYIHSRKDITIVDVYICSSSSTCDKCKESHLSVSFNTYEGHLESKCTFIHIILHNDRRKKMKVSV